MIQVPNTNAPIAGQGGIVTRAWQNFFALLASTVQPTSTTVGKLPPALNAAGTMRFVTDATATAITGLGLTAVGGGGNKVLVYSDGSNWIIL